MDLDETFGVARRPSHGERDVLAVALDVHTTNTGAYERSEEAQATDRAFLKERLAAWMPQWSNETKKDLGFLRFDEAVRHLLMAVLEEK